MKHEHSPLSSFVDIGDSESRSISSKAEWYDAFVREVETEVPGVHGGRDGICA